MVLIQLNTTIINSSSQLGKEKQPCKNGNAYVEKRCIGVINIKNVLSRYHPGKIEVKYVSQ